MEFKKHKLGEFIDYISDTTPILKEKVILINTSDVENGETLNHKYVENKNLKGQFKKRFKKGDILYSEIRPKNKRFAYIDFDSNDYIASTKLMVLRNNGNINNDFLFQILKSDTVIDYLQMIAESRSGTFPQITFNELSNVEIYIPDIEIQKKISNFLQKIDKKIKLNNQINDNLFKLITEQYNEVIEKNEEYEVVKLKDIAVIGSGKRPKVKGKEFLIPLIGASGIMDYTDNYNFEEDIIIIGRVGTLGVVQRYFDKIWASDNTLTIKAEFKNVIENYLKNVDYIALNRGSTQPLITQTDISNLDIKYNKEMFKKFEEMVVNIREKIYKNELENKTLEQLRDTLLPKLMNGEIDLDKIES